MDIKATARTRRMKPILTIFLTTFFCFAITLSRAAEENDPGLARLFNDEGFAIPDSGDHLRFPRDHGSHPKFKSEWWYLTGHFSSQDQETQYGFQLTFFRAAQKSAQEEGELEQFYMAHAALFDKKNQRFFHEERLNKEKWNADAAIGKMDVFNENWYLKMIDDDAEIMKCRFSINSEYPVKLSLKPLKKKNLFGTNGVSKKGDELGASSYYINYSRLKVEGTISVAGTEIEVDGLAWMDHEISSSQLSEDQIGWNWTSLILNDGTELMAYVMRRKDGTKDPNSSLTTIAKDGTLQKIKSRDFEWIGTREWQSPRTKATYPVDHTLTWRDSNNVSHSVVVKALGDDQELQGRIGSFVYWEGACHAYDENGELIGAGYTELTGYDSSLQGRF